MIEQDFSVGDTPRLRVRLRSGSLDVIPGRDGTIRVEIDTDDSSFLVDQRSETVVVEAADGGRPALRAAVTAYVPPGSEIDVATTSANVSCRLELARLDISTASGDIRFHAIDRLQAKTASGGVSGDTVTGEARAMTASGEIRLGKLDERANLSTASGDIIVGVAGGDVSVTSASGDIRIDQFTGPELRVKSVSGNVRLGIPRRTRLDLDAKTLSGSVRLPTPDPNPGSPEREMTALVKLVSGDLKIIRTD